MTIVVVVAVDVVLGPAVTNAAAGYRPDSTITRQLLDRQRGYCDHRGESRRQIEFAAYLDVGYPKASI